MLKEQSQQDKRDHSEKQDKRDHSEPQDCEFGKACWFRSRCWHYHPDRDYDFWDKNPKKNKRGRRNNRNRRKNREEEEEMWPKGGW